MTYPVGEKVGAPGEYHEPLIAENYWDSAMWSDEKLPTTGVDDPCLLLQARR